MLLGHLTEEAGRAGLSVTECHSSAAGAITHCDRVDAGKERGLREMLMIRSHQQCTGGNSPLMGFISRDTTARPLVTMITL